MYGETATFHAPEPGALSLGELCNGNAQFLEQVVLVLDLILQVLSDKTILESKRLETFPGTP